MEALESSIVHRNLDTKLKIGPLEALDLLAALIISSFMGFFFEGGILGFIFIFLVPLLFLGGLFFVKRNRPENFLRDFIRFTFKRGFYGASCDLMESQNLSQKIYIKSDAHE